MPKTRIAAIDIGSNSIRCIVAEAAKAGRFRVLDDEKVTVRLGENLTKTGLISAEASERTIEAIRRFQKFLSGFKVGVVEAVATSAVRKAGNGKELVRILSRELGHEVRIISGEEEAELAATSALFNFDMNGKRYAMADIGGGSLEVVTAFGNHIEECYTFDLGTVIMTEQFLSSDPIKAAELKQLQRHIRACLKKTFGKEKITADTLIGSGGTITSLGWMVMNKLKESYASIHGYEMLHSEVIHQHAMLIRKDLKGRGTISGLNPDRADIIVAGVTVIDELMKFFNANRLLVNERGIREGLIIRAMKRQGLIAEVPSPRDWREVVMEFARSCHVDEPHALHVAHLALSIFDSLAVPFELSENDRKILEAASILHDVGYFIGYSSHHKHTYHLIRHADLYGFSSRDRELMAQIARYHRKSPPKRKHAAFQALHDKDRLIVSRLGGILRMADGLDRRRAGLVHEVSCELRGKEITINLESTEDISVEIFGANTKKDLFEKAFGAGAVFVA